MTRMGGAMAKTARLLALTLALVTALGGGALGAQEDLAEKLVRSYDLLEAGKLGQAKQLYQEILARHPDHPLALNNLAFIQIKEGKLAEAQASLEKALLRAKGYRLKVNKVCAVDGICLAFRPGGPAYGDQELEPLVALNLHLLRDRMAQRQSGS